MLYYKQKICDKEGEQMTIDLALEKMIPGMQEIYGDMVDSIILYGSTACGTRAEDLGYQAVWAFFFFKFCSFF